MSKEDILAWVSRALSVAVGLAIFVVLVLTLYLYGGPTLAAVGSAMVAAGAIVLGGSYQS